MWGYATSPQYVAQPPPGMTQLQMVKDFDHRIWYLRQTLQYGWSRTFILDRLKHLVEFGRISRGSLCS